MSRHTVQVTTGHLRELAAKHGQAATDVTAATDAPAGVDSRIRRSHGAVAWATAAAVGEIQRARIAAGQGMAGECGALCGHLITAARRYEDTDHESGADLGRRLRP
ncbi:Protein of unknown function (DUF2580) [Mycolicibacterium chubuense NBB4]|uniref:ESX-1 secretion-associated protein n=1 Tax=Mycolicibacterium chubuense (strain NBB4) TaxID=710421 RepID=I4BC91_MYCCN|nr:type VII secretion target [Mycolicibacterium chubuense]AFM14898.1 Protein of unknown function (DUF2580) [Mycolicibacterium chubuense NBB4]